MNIVIRATSYLQFTPSYKRFFLRNIIINYLPRMVLNKNKEKDKHPYLNINIIIVTLGSSLIYWSHQALHLN